MFINFSKREISFKIVYYGAGLSGKTTSLQKLYASVKKGLRGELVQLATDTQRTLYFDFFPFTLTTKGYKINFHVYSTPGHVLYRQARKLILKGTDGVIFVADCARDRLEANIVALEELHEDLRVQLTDIPIVFQFNKQDLKEDKLSEEELRRALNCQGHCVVPTCAISGQGVASAFKQLAKTLIKKLAYQRKINRQDRLLSIAS
jgi:small GTP-binding protein